MHPLRTALDGSLLELGARIGHALELDDDGAVALQCCEPPSDVVIEWIDAASCVAIHAPFPVPPSVDRAALAGVLLKCHLAGAATAGCSFWMLPDESVRVGFVLAGTALGVDQLVEAIGRVSHVAGRTSQ